MRIQSLPRFLLVLIVMTCLASIASAQAAPVCGVPGTPACTPTPRPTDLPTTPPTQAPAEQPAQPTAAPTTLPTPTEAPLIPLPTTGPCVAAPAGNFRVNVRDWPGESGEIVDVLSPDDVVPARGHVKVFDGRTGWTATDGGFISEPALRFGGEDCDALPVVDVPAGTAPFVLTNDADEDGDPDTVLVLRAPDSGETSDDDICIEYPYRNPHGGGGTICLPFDITGTAVVCIDGHCVVVEGGGAAHEPEFHIADGVVLPPVDDDGIAGSRLIVAFPGIGETQGNVYHGPFDPDICIEHSVANPWGGVATMCISADVGGGDVYCQDGHCVSVLD
ncbi:MAG: SH3 domain-containing protein [Chloroflexi bacterium]|nr:SH3 domain-containing protein [Chloroflexota bacterium]